MTPATASLRVVPDQPVRTLVTPPSGIVRRPGLVRGLAAADASLVALIAPAGYGKTTLLREWAATESRPHAWITLTAAHDDPAILSRLLGEPVREPPFVLFLDRLDAVSDRRALELIAGIVAGLAPGSIVATASRAEPRLGLGGLRAAGRLVELRRDELRMSAHEAKVLLRRAGLRLSPDQQATILRRTEGWPAGLRLAALALSSAADRSGAVARFDGADRFVADYFAEQLAELTAAQRRLLLRTSPLDSLSGNLCDAVLGRRGTGAVLRELARSNVLLEPLDHRDERFRHHPLLAQTLRAELRRTDPDGAAEVHRRAAGWFERRGDLERAIHHAVAGDDLDGAGELIWSRLPTMPELPLPRLGDHAVASAPFLALAASATRLTAGRADEAERWLAAADRGKSRPAALEAGSAVIRAAIGRGSVADMIAAAERAHALDAADSPWRALARVLSGVGHYLAGDASRAREHLEEGARLGACFAPQFELAALTQLALIALADDDLAAGAELALNARARLDDLGIADRPAAALVHAAAAFALSQLGEAHPARAEATAARRLCDERAVLPSWYEAELRLALARAELRLSDAEAARELIREAAAALRRIPGARMLQRWIDDGWERADAYAAQAVSGRWSLTSAELRVLRFLPTHLSFREVGALLHVSTNTVKTQAHAVYRKLEVSSRSEAVVKARAIGLIDV